MRYSLLILIIGFYITLVSCQNSTEISYPVFSDNSDISGLKKLQRNLARNMEGVYDVTEGYDLFGSKAVLKTSPEGISIFFGKTVNFIVANTGISGDSIIIEGYWRDILNFKTGIARLYLSNNSGAKDILAGKANKELQLSGYIIKEGKNVQNFKLKYSGPLIDDEKFYIIAHRGGGRNSDDLPASENSVELIKMASSFGANAIEIDVRITKDNIPILFHDDFISNRLVNGDLLVGPVENYYYNHLLSFCTLKHGENIPTLVQALDAAIYNSDVKLVWLDVKSEGALDFITPIIDQAKIKAVKENRRIEFVIGLSDEDKANEYYNFKNKSSYDCLCELSVDEAIKLNAKYWGPPWTLGSQSTNVNYAHSLNKKVFIWTIDDVKFIKKFLLQADFDGFVTNYPYIVAFEYYVK